MKCFSDTFPTLILNFKKIGSHIYFRSTAFEIGDSPKFELEIPLVWGIVLFWGRLEKVHVQRKNACQLLCAQTQRIEFFLRSDNFISRFYFSSGRVHNSVCHYPLVSFYSCVKPWFKSKKRLLSCSGDESDANSIQYENNSLHSSN